MNRNLWLLAVCQGLFLTNNVTFIAINGLVGLALAPRGWMATLPVMGYVVGGALATGLVARTQQRFGRRAFVPDRPRGGAGLGAAVRAGRGLAGLLAAVRRHGGGRLLQRQRQPLPLRRRRTGRARLAREGGVAGDGRRPASARWPARTSRPSRATWFAVPFAGAYLALAAVALLAMVLMHFIDFPAPPPKQRGARAAARWPRSRASRCSSSRPCRARSASA